MLFYNDLDLNNQKSLCLPSIFRFERKLGFLTTLLNGKQLFIFNKFWSFDPTVHCQQMLYIWSSSRKIWEKLAIQRRQIHKKLLKTVKSDIEFLRGWINMYIYFFEILWFKPCLSTQFNLYIVWGFVRDISSTLFWRHSPDFLWNIWLKM